MIFSLNTAMKLPVSNVKVDNIPVAYSWGNYDALIKWLVVKDKRQINSFINDKAEKKYPLIWLTDEWKAVENTPGYKFDNVTFYIACNSKVELLNENREPNFDSLYALANQFIKELKKYGKIAENSIEYQERANLTLAKSKDKTQTIDVWDALIVKMNFIRFSDCFSKTNRCSQ